MACHALCGPRFLHFDPLAGMYLMPLFYLSASLPVAVIFLQILSDHSPEIETNAVDLEAVVILVELLLNFVLTADSL